MFFTVLYCSVLFRREAERFALGGGTGGRDWCGWGNCCRGACEFGLNAATVLCSWRVPEQHWCLCSRPWRQNLVKSAENKISVCVWGVDSYVSCFSRRRPLHVFFFLCDISDTGQWVTPVGISNLILVSFRFIQNKWCDRTGWSDFTVESVQILKVCEASAGIRLLTVVLLIHFFIHSTK